MTAIIKEWEPLPDGKSQYPIEFIENNHLIKLREEEDAIVIGCTLSPDLSLLQSLKKVHKKKIKWLTIDTEDLSQYLSRKFSHSLQEEKGNAVDSGASLDKLANDAPIINLVNSILIEGIRSRASDIHLEIFEEEALVRFRVDGLLKKGMDFPTTQFPAVASRIKILSNMNIMERRLPQDGRLTAILNNEKVDMRVSIVPIAQGESIVLRILSQKRVFSGLNDLGFSEAVNSSLNRMISYPHGLFLVTGPTGCGKTTTLNAIIQEIKDTSLKVITIEDPVEYRIDGVDQIQTDENIGLGFDTLLRNVLRQDPDIIMVGEIRDKKTAQLALRASLTGHFVLSTLHTNDSLSVITRLRDMGLEPYLVSSVLRGATAQRLVRRLCPHCKEKARPSLAEDKALTALGFPLREIYHAVGCELCQGSGYQGRLSIIELWQSDETMVNMIASQSPQSEMRAYLRSIGAKTLVEDGISRLIEGQTTLSELERVLL